MEKTCIKCLVSLDLINFTTDKKMKDGLANYCRACKKAYDLIYREKNWERIKKSKAEYFQAIKNNPEFRNSRKISKQVNYSKNPEKILAKNQQYVKRLKGAPGYHTEKQVKNLFAKQSGRCYYCKRNLQAKYQKDHFIPLSKGGTNYIENIRIVCGECNASKHNLLPHRFIKERLPLLLKQN